MEKGDAGALIEALTDWYESDATQNLWEFMQGDLKALYQLDMHGSLTPSALAAKMGITRPRATAILNGLREREYINMSTDEKDRRSVKVTATKKGLSYLEQRRTKVMDYFDKVVAKLGRDNTAMLVGFLKAAKEV